MQNFLQDHKYKPTPDTRSIYDIYGVVICDDLTNVAGAPLSPPQPPLHLEAVASVPWLWIESHAQ